MLLETYRGSELREVLSQIRRTLGDDAMLVRTEVSRTGSGQRVEVVAARASDVEQLRSKLDGGRAAPLRSRGRRRIGPYVVALVGPSGSGKTTACMKAALSPVGVAHRRVGIITLDTYRVGGLEEIQTYCEIADLPLEVVCSHEDAAGALHRLRDREVVVVDTPGRGFGQDRVEWPGALAALDPDELHLVVPADVRTDVAASLAARLEGVAATHVLFTKLDEAGTEVPLAVLADAVALPARWVSSGPEVPAGLAPAAPKILSSLGIRPAEAAQAGMAAG
ncbi:MAG TPA: hypothetical protein VLH75_16745 [Longimicrobiales bacterium]|nr:hypothetical protein [Longimicrobiales bacterium]